MSIFDIVTAENVKGYYNEVVNGVPSGLGQTLFPRTKQLGLELSFIKGSGGLPVVLKPSAFDVKSTLRDRVGLETLKTDMPFFKEGMMIKEKDRQDLMTMIQTGNKVYIDLVVQKIFNDTKTLLDGAVSQEERLRMQLLTQGKIAVAANGVDFEYDYGMPVTNKLSPTKMWTDPTANVAKDLINWTFAARAKGVNLTKAVLNSTTLLLLTQNESISKALLVNGMGIVTPQMVSNYIKTTFGITLIVYDAMFKDEAGDTKKYIPDNIVSLIPDGSLGSTVFGTTPEEADLMSGGSDAQVAIVNEGMAITTSKVIDPVNVETKVSMITLPSFEKVDEVYIATVGA